MSPDLPAQPIEAKLTMQSPRLSFYGSSTSINFMALDSTTAMPFFLPSDLSESVLKDVVTTIDDKELAILKMRGAFILPEESVCKAFIEAYFTHLHPLMPVLNRTQFLAEYSQLKNPPSLLLLQCVLLGGSLFCLEKEENISHTIFVRAKALYDANTEKDPLAIVQSLMILSWFWDGPEDVTRNSFYWSRLAITVAQGFGFQVNLARDPNISLSRARLYRKVWWCLFIKDRTLAVGFGRSTVIDLVDCDVPMLSADDFFEENGDPPDPTHISYVIHQVKLAEIIGIVLRDQYTPQAIRKGAPLPIVKHCDMIMGNWMDNLPPELRYSRSNPAGCNFFAGLLMSQYYTVLSLVHRGNIIRRSKLEGLQDDYYPSWGIAFQTSHNVALIAHDFVVNGFSRYVPSFYITSLFNAAMNLVFHFGNLDAKIANVAKRSFDYCLQASRDAGRVYSMGKAASTILIKLKDDPARRENILRGMIEKVGYPDMSEPNFSEVVKAEPTPAPDLYLFTQSYQAPSDQFKPAQLFPDTLAEKMESVTSDDSLNVEIMNGINTNWTPSFDFQTQTQDDVMHGDGKVKDWYNFVS